MNEPAAVSPPIGRMIIAALSLIGLFVALYLLAHHLGWVGHLMCGVGDCATVQASKWASVGPVPTAGIGLAGYVALLIVSILGLQPAYLGSRWVSGALLAMASVALAFSVFLTYLEAFVIHAWCQWCVMSAILVVLIFTASLSELPRLRQHTEGGAA